MSGVQEQVTIRVWMQCAGCGRKLDTSETIPGNSLRTGNHTQRAEYWLDRMRASILGAAQSRQWDSTEKGPRCAHCRAAELDKLGNDAGKLA